MKKVDAMLKGLKTKKSIVEVVRNFNSKDLTTEGKAIIEYLLNLFNADMKDMTLTEMKKEVMTLVSNNAFKDMKKVDVLFENAVKPKLVKKKDEEKKETTEEDDALDKIVNIVSKKKEDAKVDKETVKNGVKQLSPEDIFELCRYRYVYPTFPQTLETPAVANKVLTRVDTDSHKEVSEMWDATFNDESFDLVVAMYFPEYERDYDIDPHNVTGDAPKKTLLKKYGGKYPSNVDIQSIVHFDPVHKNLVTVSTLTGIPYVIDCKDSLFVTNERLNCRVSQNGLDYQFYTVK